MHPEMQKKKKNTNNKKKRNYPFPSNKEKAELTRTTTKP